MTCSAKSLVASRRNLGLMGASYCNDCGILVPDDLREVHLKERHGIVVSNEQTGAQSLCL